MITLLATAGDPTERELREALRESCLAHEVVVDPKDLPPGARLPALIDEGVIHQGREAILARLDELRALREEWHKYGSDACYCDADGNVL